MRHRLSRVRLLVLAGLAAGITVAGAVLVTQPALAAAATATFTKSSDWGTGYEAKYTITNGTTSTINAWTVAFDLPAGHTLGTYWDALMSTSGQHVTATNRTYNGTIAPGGSTSFGFIVNGGSGAPANCTLNGASCGGGGGGGTTTTPPGAPGTPGDFRVTGQTNSSISVAWNASTGTVTGYRVYEGTTVRATVTGTSATLSGLGACTSHTYTVAAYNGNGESAKSASATGTTSGCTSTPGKMAAPYLYLGWGDPPSVSTVMSATGIKQFTMAFMLSGGGCTPAWDGTRPLTGGTDQSVINSIRAGGGDIEISFGGWQGNKLGPNCSSASALAGAYQQVINAYALKFIDIDIENIDEFENEAVQDRILGALKIVKQNNPGIKTIITFGTSTTGPNWWGTRLINQSAALGANIDVYTIMPFDFGGGGDMFGNTVNAAEGLKNALKTAFGWSDATAYAHLGLSGMNGLSDQQENTTPSIWTQIRDWANSHHIARLAFWSVNRDRPCAGGGVVSNCSGIAQNNWQFTQITAGFTG